MSMMVSFVLSFFPRDVLDEILNLIESVSEDFPSYSQKYARIENIHYLWQITFGKAKAHVQSCNKEHHFILIKSLDLELSMKICLF